MTWFFAVWYFKVARNLHLTQKGHKIQAPQFHDSMMTKYRLHTFMTAWWQQDDNRMGIVHQNFMIRAGRTLCYLCHGSFMAIGGKLLQCHFFDHSFITASQQLLDKIDTQHCATNFMTASQHPHGKMDTQHCVSTFITTSWQSHRQRRWCRH